MTVRKVLLAAAAAAALTTTPAWAEPGGHGRGAHEHPPHAQGPKDPRSQPEPHRCTPHGVAYVAAGTLVSHTLVPDGAEPTPTVARVARGPQGPTYSGEVTIAVTRANRHARADKGTTKTYTLDHARVLHFADAVAGSRAKVIGTVTKLARRCDQTGFTPELTIRKLLLHAAQSPPTS